MSSIGELTVNLKLSIDEGTALVCLKIAEMYANQIDATVDVNRNAEGEIALFYKRIAQELGIKPTPGKGEQ